MGPMKNRIKAVRSGIEICSEVYEDEGTSAREKGMKQQEAMTKYQVVSKQAQNRKHQKSKAASANQWLSSKASRSTLQTKSKQADYAEDDFEIAEISKNNLGSHYSFSLLNTLHLSQFFFSVG